MTDPNNNINASPQVAFCLAISEYFGIDCEQDSAGARELLQEVHASSTTDPNLKRWARIFENMINDEERLWVISVGTRSARIKKANELIRLLAAGGESWHTAVESIKNDVVVVTEELSNRVWAMTIFYLLLQDQRASAWLDFFREHVETKRLGTSRDAVISAMKDCGIPYNITNDDDYPLPGVFSKSAAADPAIPPAGITGGYGKFLGLSGLPDGRIDFHFDAPRGHGPYLTPADIDVVLALVFGDPIPIWPKFSLDALKGPHKRECSLAEKVWEPAWLADTEFGRTLFATDLWIGRLSWNADKFNVDPTSQFANAAKVLLNRIEPPATDRPSGRHQIRPDTVEWAWNEPPSGELRCQMRSVKIRIDGSEILRRPDGSEDRTHLLNSNESREGRVANFLTDNYDVIAMLWPMFERLRQQMALLYAVHELKKKGFVPEPELAQHINNVLARRRASPAIALSNRIVLQN